MLTFVQRSNHSKKGDFLICFEQLVYFQRFATEKAIPKKLTVTVDGRGGARVKEFDFDITEVPVSNRAAKGVTVTKWLVKTVKPAE